MYSFTHMGVFRQDTTSKIVLRFDGQHWVAPNGCFFEADTPLLDIRTIPPHKMNGAEKLIKRNG